MGKGKPKSKGTKLQLGEFLGDNAGNTVNIGGKTVEMPSAPKAATLEIDITKVPNRTLLKRLRSSTINSLLKNQLIELPLERQIAPIPDPF